MFQRVKDIIYRSLRWSEKYTKTDMVYLAKGGGWMTLGRVVSMLVAFGLSIAFANLLPKETYGQYKYVLSLVSLLMLFTLSGMGTAIARAVAQGKDGVLKPAIKAEMLWGLLGSAVALMLAVYYYWRGDYILAPSFLVVALFVPFLNVYGLYSAILQGKKRFDLLIRYDVLTQFTNFILLLPLLLITKQIWILILPMLVINSLLQKVWLWRTEKNVVINQIIDRETIKYGKHLSLINVLSTIATYADQLLVFSLLGPVQMAIYNMALAPTEQIKGFIKMITTLTFPKFAQQPVSLLKKSMPKKIVMSTIVVLLGGIIYIVFARFLYTALFPKYLDAIYYSQLLMVSLITSAAATFYLSALQAHGAKRQLYFLNTLGPILELLVLGGLIYAYGLFGAVVGRIVFRTLNTFFAYFCWKSFAKNTEKQVI